MAAQGFFHEHWKDGDGNPAGGCTTGRGFTISWQNGPLGPYNDRKEPNGAFVEDVLSAVAGRIQFYQASQFACATNAEALAHISAALSALEGRTVDREDRAVEGTHAV